MVQSKAGAYTVALEGCLPDNKRLTKPLCVVIEHGDGEVIVTEPQFYIHAAGRTEAEALEAFKRRLVGYLDVLGRREETLGARLHDQLQFLRAFIRVA